MKHRFPYLVTGLYLFLVVLSVVPIFTEEDALSGVFAVILTQPWPTLLSRIVPDGIAGGLLLIAVGAIINASLLFLICRWIRSVF